MCYAYFKQKETEAMARKKEFDKEVVLTKAMQTFWQHGYEATSMQQLVSSMGINRGSLYDTFGDKRSLFLAAIAHYESTVVKKMTACLSQPDADLQTIVALFDCFVDTIVDEQGCYGCLITNTAVELCPHDPETQRKIAQSFAQMTFTLQKTLKNAQAKEQISQSKDPQALANYLTSSLQGLRVLGKVNRDRQTLENIVAIILASLD